MTSSKPLTIEEIKARGQGHIDGLREARTILAQRGIRGGIDFLEARIDTEERKLKQY